MPFRRSPAPAQGQRRKSTAPGAGTGSERPGPSYPPTSQVMDQGDFGLDDDEEVRDEDLALDDDSNGMFDGTSNDGAEVSAEDLDVDVELDDEEHEEVDPVTTVDELQYAEAAGPGLRLRPSTLTGNTSSTSQSAKRKATRKRVRSTADTGVHRKPNVPHKH